MSDSDVVLKRKITDLFNKKDFLIGTKEIMETLGVSRSSMDRWAANEIKEVDEDSELLMLPEPAFKLGRKYKWFRSDIMAWLAKQKPDR